MRFVPEYYSDSDTESDLDIASSVTSTEDIDKLPEFLFNKGLDKRFDDACTVAKNNEGQIFRFPLNRKVVNSNDHSNKDDNNINNINNINTTDSTCQYSPYNLENYYVSRFSDTREKRNNIVKMLIKQEEERINREEEERRRKIEEERLRQEEAKRKAREEAERLRQEELKRREEEKKRLEEQEKAKQEAIRKQEELRLQKEKEDALAASAIAKAKKEEELKREQEEQDKIIIKPKEIESLYLKYTQVIKNIESTVLEPMNQNKDLKKLCGMHRRKINPKFGQLTNSQSQLTRITKEINELVLQTKGNGLVYKWILNFISDAIISQAETEVSVKPNSSIQLAKLTLNLLILFDELNYYLLAKFYTSCPYLMGYSCSQDTEEGRTRLGWKRDEDNGKWENEVQYNERLSGISTLYSVITKLKLNSSYIGYNPSSTKHPLPISHSWIFLSRILDVPENQITETHYTIVGAWWDACAFEFLQAYGIQSRKLLKVVVNEWSSLGGKSSAGKVRLKLLGEEWMKGTVKCFPPLEN
ncbi:hypothetical protein C6P42_000692 [Pichia californica]|nr:hypothetical protein C6P42_000692 [[Candida] californica]